MSLLPDRPYPTGGPDSDGFGPLSKLELAILYEIGAFKQILAVNGPDGTPLEN